MKKEFSRKDLLELLKKHESNGKISFGSLGEIVFDSRFPDELFKNAKEEIIKARNDENRYKELADILLEKYNKLFNLEREINQLSLEFKKLEQIRKLKEEQNTIEEKIKPLESEFEEIKLRISDRKRE